ncbi:hypothetical protein [Streptomyces sp. NPDC056600]|uniref:hypothetical protein n=1 Tax=Streptomyces sp. NPDC056600 TaxID=3345874 RepID=UPI0036D0F43B
MAYWLLTCNRDIFDLDAFRRDEEELESWSVARYRKELTAHNQFVMWLTGPQGGLVGHGHITGEPFFLDSVENAYWQEDPGPRWYVPLEIDQWLDAPVPRARFTADARFDGTTTLRTLFAGNPHRLNAAQWQAFEEAFGGAPRNAVTPVTTLTQPDAPVERPQPPSPSVGNRYQSVDESVQPVPAQPAPADAGLTGRNLRAHRRLQNRLAATAAAQGLEVISPSATGPDFDLAWRDASGTLTVCEVKSLTEVNETRQLRTGLGQILDYHDLLREGAPEVRAVLWVEHEPQETRWIELCRRVGVTLAWPGREADVLSTVPMASDRSDAPASAKLPTGPPAPRTSSR